MAEREVKRLWQFCLAVLAASILAGATGLLAAECKVIYRSRFDIGGGWRTWPGSMRFEIDKSVSREGTASLKVSGTRGVVYTYVPMRENVRYRAEFCFRGEAVAGQLELSLNFNKPGGGNGSAGRLAVPVPGPYPADAWRTVSAEIITPPGTTVCQFSFSFAKVTAGTVWISGLSIVDSGQTVDPPPSRYPAGPYALVPLVTAAAPGAPREGAAYCFTDNANQTAFVSPDLHSMISFRGLRAELRPALVLELPAEITLVGGMRNVVFEEPQPVQRDGDEYRRWTLRPGDPGGWIRLFWKTTLAAGRKRKGYYWAQWNKQRQPERELAIEVLHIEKTRPLHGLLTFLSVPSDLAAGWPDYGDFTGIGLSVLDFWPYTRERSKWGLEILREIQQKTKDSGVRLAAWPGEWWWSEAIQSDADAQAAFADGRKVRMLCPSYRGPRFQKLLEHGRFLLDEQLSFHTFDPEIWSDAEKICFCGRCRAGFAEYLRKQRPKLAPVGPEEFAKAPAQYPEHVRAWSDFKTGLCTGIFADYRREMERHLRETRSSAKLTMMIYSSYHRYLPSFFGYDDYRQAPLWRRTLEDPRGLAGVFDYLAPMVYVDVYANYMDYDMLLPWKDISSLRRVSGATRPVTPILSAGFPFLPGYGSELTPQMMRWQILETVASGARGFGFWGACPLDAADLQAIADTVRILLPAEKILAQGVPIPEDRLRDARRETFVKGVESADGAVILVSEYSPRRRLAMVEYQGAKGSRILNLSTGQTRESTVNDKAVFPVELGGDRTGLFFIGSK